MIAATVIIGVVATGCSRSDNSSQTQETASTASAPAKNERQVFEARGVVQEVRAGEKEIVIKHEAT